MGRYNYIKVRNTAAGSYQIACERCGDTLELVPPLPMDVFTREGKRFEKEHRACLPLVVLGMGRAADGRQQHVRLLSGD